MRTPNPLLSPLPLLGHALVPLQDGAQNVESSTCLTLIERAPEITDPHDPEGHFGPGIIMSVTMPSVVSRESSGVWEGRGDGIIVSA